MTDQVPKSMQCPLTQRCPCASQEHRDAVKYYERQASQEGLPTIELASAALAEEAAEHPPAAQQPAAPPGGYILAEQQQLQEVGAADRCTSGIDMITWGAVLNYPPS
jgi:hypothetical protein